jgi:hypothetical protein
MTLIPTQLKIIVRDAIPNEQLHNFRGIVNLFGWEVIPFGLYQKSLTALPFTTHFNLNWLHTFFEVHATKSEKKDMLEAGYQQRS